MSREQGAELSVEDLPPVASETGEAADFTKTPLAVKATILTLLNVFVGILAFWPSTSGAFYLTKATVIYLPILAVVALFGLVVIRQGKLPTWHRSLFLSSGLLLITLLLSAFTGTNWRHSFFGYGFEIGSVFFVLTMFVFTYVVSGLFRDQKRAATLYLTMVGAGALLLVWFIARLVAGASFLSFGMFNDLSITLVGSLNDLGIFLVLLVSLTVATLQYLNLRLVWRTALGVIMYLSLLSLVAVNFALGWQLLMLASIILVYFTRRDPDQMVLGETAGKTKKTSIHLKLVLLVALAFTILPFLKLGWENKVPATIGVSYLEAKPSWRTTSSLYQNALKENLWLGVGENHFQGVWNRYKSVDVIQSDFWSVDFNYAVGFIPTLALLTGLLGTIALGLFLLALLYTLIRCWRERFADPLTKYIFVSAYLGTIVLWLVNILYVSTFVIVFLSFVFLGLLLATLYREGVFANRTIDLNTNKFASNVTVVVGAVVIIAALSAGYHTFIKYQSFSHFQNSITAINEDRDFEKSEALLVKAVSLDPQDIYFRSLSELTLLRLNAIVTLNGGRITEEIAPGIQELLNNTVGAARDAIRLRPENYLNQLFIARLYGSFVAGGLPGAYEKASESYQEALKLNPTNPGIYLELARVELANNNSQAAREAIEKALALKINYTEAILLLSQIDVSEGKVRESIRGVESVIQTSPDNPALYFQLGLLHYNQRDYPRAQVALERAIILVPDYANARYFLGLTYYRLEDTASAIDQFEAIAATNPENTEVVLILNNLKSGFDPFTNVAPPLDDQPESRDTPPIEETVNVSDER